MASLFRPEWLELDVQARLDLIEELWDSIAADEEMAAKMPVTAEERGFVQERLREHRADPSRAIPWSVMRPRVFKTPQTR